MSTNPLAVERVDAGNANSGISFHPGCCHRPTTVVGLMVARPLVIELHREGSGAVVKDFEFVFSKRR